MMSYVSTVFARSPMISHLERYFHNGFHMCPTFIFYPLSRDKYIKLIVPLFSYLGFHIYPQHNLLQSLRNLQYISFSSCSFHLGSWDSWVHSCEIVTPGDSSFLAKFSAFVSQCSFWSIGCGILILIFITLYIH
jgi:hypothetical protein